MPNGADSHYADSRPRHKPVNIVHVTHSLDPAAGGLPVVPVRLAAAQAALGHRVTVLATCDAAAQFEVPQLFAGVPGIDRVKHGWLPPARVSSIVGRSALRRTLTRHCAGVEMVHLHGIWAPMIAAAAGVARRLGIPYFVAPHGMLDPWSLSQKRWKKRLALMLGWRRILNQAAAIHCLNADERELLAPLKLSARMVVVPNGIFLEEVAPGDTRFSDGHSGLDSAPYVLFLSRLHYKKGLDILAAAFQTIANRVPNAHLVVAGPDGGARRDLEERIRASGLAPRVHLVGPLLGPAKWAALRDSSCFCLPSRQEGFSIAILEALASRTPVVISKACHFPEVEEVRAGEVTELSVADVAAALERILTADEPTRRHWGEAGRRLVEDRFTWLRAAETSIAAYHDATKAG